MLRGNSSSGWLFTELLGIQDMEHQIEKRMVDEIFSASEAYENLLVLADDIGIRLAGTPNEIAARDFLAGTLSRYGLDQVHTETFQHRAWTPVREELHIVDPIERPLVCRCAGLSPSTPEDGVEGGWSFSNAATGRNWSSAKSRCRGVLS